MQTAIYALDVFGTAVFAITGSLAAGKKRMDLFGVVVLATVTAVGGGTLRDVSLGITPVFWVDKPIYLVVAASTGILTFFAVRFCQLPVLLLAVADAVGLAVFTVIGTQKALSVGTVPGIAVVMGVMTAVVGGMVRDALSGEIPLILRREIYATASLCGAVVFVVVLKVASVELLAVCVSSAITLGIRLSAIRWRLGLPLYPTRQERREA